LAAQAAKDGFQAFHTTPYYFFKTPDMFILLRKMNISGVLKNSLAANAAKRSYDAGRFIYARTGLL
jgi:hypothetical protein